MEIEAIPLPNFKNPPVVETALSVQFEKIPRFRAVHFGLFWSRMRDRYPLTEEMPPVDSEIERFPLAPLDSPQLRFQILDQPALPRLWFQNTERTELLQLQNNRFLKNWRKQREADTYPRYDLSIKPGFDNDFLQFQSFLNEEKLGELSINQCEVTYVNHIVSGEGWRDFAEADRIFTFWRGMQGNGPENPESLRIQMQFPIAIEGGSPVGRLHVEVSPAVHASGLKPMFVMVLIARGQMGGNTDFLDLGRQWIVRSFERLTTSHMHAIWRKL